MIDQNKTFGDIVLISYLVIGQSMVAAEIQVAKLSAGSQQMASVEKLWTPFSRVNFGPTTPIFELDI